jgi:peroxiredoxin
MKWVIYSFLLITVAAKAQTGKEIFVASAAKIASLKNISYNIYTEGSAEKITADVTIARGGNSAVFDGSRIKVSGLAIDDAGSKQISYSYDGSSFTFADLKTSDMVKLDSPSYPKMSRTGLFTYTMLALGPYWQTEPFAPVLSQIKSIDHVTDTLVYGVPCYKLDIVQDHDTQLGKITSASTWFIGRKDSLLYGFRTKTSKYLVRVRSVNADLPKEFFNLAPKQVRNMTGLEPIGDGLLAAGTKAPAWSLPSSSGKSLSLESLKGKVVLLDFWGTWCVPCIRAMPEIQAIHETFKGQPVTVIGVSVETEKNADPLGFVKSKGYTYPIVLNGHNITKDYKVQVFPSVYLIDKKGNIIHAEYGGNRANFREDLVNKIKKALAN